MTRKFFKFFKHNYFLPINIIIISLRLMFWPICCLFHWQRQRSDVDVEKNNDEALTNNCCISDVNNSSTHLNPTKSNPIRKAVNHYKSVFIRTFKKRVVVVFSSLLFITLVIPSVWYYMGWMYGLQAIFVAVLAVLAATGGWYYIGHWLYIAIITAPRDIR